LTGCFSTLLDMRSSHVNTNFQAVELPIQPLAPP
jgi:hypothetical protein